MVGEKTEKATPKKKRDSRKEGEVAKSIEVNNVFSLIAIILVIQTFGPKVGSNMVGFVSRSLSIGDYSAMPSFTEIVKVYASVVAPFMIVAFAVGVLISYLQVGILFTPKVLMPKGNRISPLQGMKRIFSGKTVFNMVKTLIKLGIIVVISYVSLNEIIPEMSQFGRLEIGESIERSISLLLRLCVKIAIGLLVNAVLDYGYNMFEHNKKLKMTKQEVKDEHKKTEGDPQIKANIRGKQQKMAKMRMMQAVPEADVVITNPTHYAIALKYEIGKGSAPVVVAKGQDLVAQKIKQIAKENSVEIVEKKTVARMLYSNVDIGESIPYEYFQAVAEILAYVYNKKKNMVKGLDEN